LGDAVCNRIFYSLTITNCFTQYRPGRPKRFPKPFRSLQPARPAGFAGFWFRGGVLSGFRTKQTIDYCGDNEIRKDSKCWL